MNDYETDDELVKETDFSNRAPSSDSETDSSAPIRISTVVTSLNATPVNNIDQLIHQRVHKHQSACFTADVFIKSVAYLLNKRIKSSCSPSNFVDTERKYLNLLSIDDGYQDENPSPLVSSVSSDRDQGALSDASSEGFYCQPEYTSSSTSTTSALPDNRVRNRVVPFIDNLRRNFFLPNRDKCPSLPSFHYRFYESLEKLIDFFVEKFNSDESDWLKTNSMEMIKMDVMQVRAELSTIFQSIFSEKINWGRIIAMIGFVCELSSSAFVIERYELIEEYIGTSVGFVDEFLWEWISQHGGWEGLMEFQTGQSSSSNEMDIIVGGLTRFARVAALALAGIALCKYVAEHI